MTEWGVKSIHHRLGPSLPPGLASCQACSRTPRLSEPRISATNPAWARGSGLKSPPPCSKGSTSSWGARCGHPSPALALTHAGCCPFQTIGDGNSSELSPTAAFPGWRILVPHDAHPQLHARVSLPSLKTPLCKHGRAKYFRQTVLTHTKRHLGLTVLFLQVPYL